MQKGQPVSRDTLASLGYTFGGGGSSEEKYPAAKGRKQREYKASARVKEEREPQFYDSWGYQPHTRAKTKEYNAEQMARLIKRRGGYQARAHRYRTGSGEMPSRLRSALRRTGASAIPTRENKWSPQMVQAGLSTRARNPFQDALKLESKYLHNAALAAMLLSSPYRQLAAQAKRSPNAFNRASFVLKVLELANDHFPDSEEMWLALYKQLFNDAKKHWARRGLGRGKGSRGGQYRYVRPGSRSGRSRSRKGSRSGGSKGKGGSSSRSRSRGRSSGGSQQRSKGKGKGNGRKRSPKMQVQEPLSVGLGPRSTSADMYAEL
jgi:hypothetical protein